MALPRIANTEPIVITPIESKSYPDLYIMGLNINVQIRGDQRIMNGRIRSRPFDYDTNELGPETEGKVLLVQDMQAVAEQRALAGKPALAQALGAVLTAANEILAEGNSTIQPE